MIQTKSNVKEATIHARIIRANGTIEEVGEIAKYKGSFIHRFIESLKGSFFMHKNK